MQRIIVVCAGGHGAVVADILRRARMDGAGSAPIGFVDDTPALQGTSIEGLPVLGTIPALHTLPHDGIVIALGDNHLRRALTDRLAGLGERLVSAIHPRSTVAASAQIEAAVVVGAGAIIMVRARIGRGAVINTNASVDHDTVVGDFAHVSPGVTVGANVLIGQETLLAPAACVVAHRRVGARSVIGAGAVVVRDIPDDVIAFGNPARVQPPRGR
jgi:sugar O-acyltransferase (sialic acid O-acetyltransferase NeuD family)